MWKRIKKIAEFAKLGWLFGGGFVIAIGSLVLDWRIALIIFCIWMISCIIGILVLINRS